MAILAEHQPPFQNSYIKSIVLSIDAPHVNDQTAILRIHDEIQNAKTLILEAKILIILHSDRPERKNTLNILLYKMNEYLTSNNITNTISLDSDSYAEMLNQIQNCQDIYIGIKEQIFSNDIGQEVKSIIHPIYRIHIHLNI